MLFCLEYVHKGIGIVCLIKEPCTALDVVFCLYNVRKAIGIVCLIKEPCTALDVVLSVQCAQNY